VATFSVPIGFTPACLQCWLHHAPVKLAAAASAAAVAVAAGVAAVVASTATATQDRDQKTTTGLSQQLGGDLLTFRKSRSAATIVFD